MKEFLMLLVMVLTTCSTTPATEEGIVTTYGTFTSVREEYSQFKSYDDEVWWLIDNDDIEFAPKVNKPCKITFYNNFTEDCGHDYCDCCWREDDILLKIEEIK
jgi:hypothetical protein